MVPKVICKMLFSHIPFLVVLRILHFTYFNLNVYGADSVTGISWEMIKYAFASFP